jgi:pimeloyl-ACP methyl ester carboxylesterase/DNA-binding SARP family transcriptional activator
VDQADEGGQEGHGGGCGTAMARTVRRRRPLGVRWQNPPMDTRTDATPPLRTIELVCAGYPELQVDGRRIALKLKRGLALLVHLGDTLVGTNRRVARDKLADLLWPDAPGDVGRGRLRRLCHQVNTLVGFDLLVGDADAVWLAAERVQLDSDVLRARRAAMQLVTDPAAAESRRSLELACAPGAAHILNGFDAGSAAFEAWLEGRRAEQERLVMRALSRSAEHLLAAGQPMLAAEAAGALIRLEPLADAGHAWRLAAQGQLGDAAGVESAYFACAELLRDELGIRPSAQIEAAYAQARARLATATEQEPRAASALPPIRFADTDDGAVAYLELGSRAAPGGTMVILFGLWSHVEVAWDQPVIRATLDRLARRFHVVLMDRRGTGLSERLTLRQSVETGMADLEAVRCALGVERVWVFANSIGANFGIEYAVRHHERVRGLLLYAAAARGAWAADYPWALTPAQLEAWLAKLTTSWGGATSLEQFAPSVAHDPTARDWWARLLRQSLTRNSLPRLLRSFAAMDVRDRLPQVRVPTLVVHREGDRIVRAAAARHLAEHIDGARLVLLPGEDNLMWWGDTEAVIDRVESFVETIRESSP